MATYGGLNDDVNTSVGGVANVGLSGMVAERGYGPRLHVNTLAGMMAATSLQMAPHHVPPG